MRDEPTAIIGAVGGFLSAAIKVAVLLHLVDWDATQLAGISLLIDAGLTLGGVLLIRSKVTPTASPTLPENKPVTLPDGTAGKVTKA